MALVVLRSSMSIRLAPDAVDRALEIVSGSGVACIAIVV